MAARAQAPGVDSGARCGLRRQVWTCALKHSGGCWGGAGRPSVRDADGGGGAVVRRPAAPAARHEPRRQARARQHRHHRPGPELLQGHHRRGYAAIAAVSPLHTRWIPTPVCSACAKTGIGAIQRVLRRTRYSCSLYARRNVMSHFLRLIVAAHHSSGLTTSSRARCAST